MDLQNIECQLAQAQMGRYLAGDSLPEDTLKQLEKHISKCENCQQAAEDKRISLEELLHKEEVSEPEPEPEPAPPVDLEVAELDDSTIMAALATAIPMPEPDPAPEPEPQLEPAAEPAPEPSPAVEASDDPFADLMQAIPPAIEEFEAQEEPVEPTVELAEAIEALEPVAVAVDASEPEPVSEPSAGGRTITIHIPDLKTLLADKKKVLILGGGLVAVLGGMSFMMKSMKPAIGTKVLAAKDAGMHEEEEHKEEKPKVDKPQKEEKAHGKEDSKKPVHGESKKEPESKPEAHQEKPKPVSEPEPETKPHSNPKPKAEMTTAGGTEEFEVAKSDGTVAKAAVVPGKGVQKTPIQPAKPAKPGVSRPAPQKKWSSRKRANRPVRRKSKSGKKSFVKVYGVTVHD